MSPIPSFPKRRHDDAPTRVAEKRNRDALLNEPSTQPTQTPTASPPMPKAPRDRPSTPADRR